MTEISGRTHWLAELAGQADAVHGATAIADAWAAVASGATAAEDRRPRGPRPLATVRNLRPQPTTVREVGTHDE